MNTKDTGCNVLIYDDQAMVYQDVLQKKFPGVTFQAAKPGSANEQLFQSCEVLITFSTTLDAKTLNNANRLKWVQALSAGTDKLEARLKSRPDVLLTSVSGIHGPFLSEMVVFQMLSLVRHAKTLYRQQESATWNRVTGSLLHGKRAMVVGTGASGEQIRRLCSTLGMSVCAASRTPRELPDAVPCISVDDLRAHVADIDFLILALALTAETENCINQGVLSSMKRGSYLINVARGGVLDEAALLTELNNGRIAGAALDVFSTEPLPATHPLWSHPNVLVTPHVAGLIGEYADHALPILEKNLRAYVSGNIHQMVNVVSRQVALAPETLTISP